MSDWVEALLDERDAALEVSPEMRQRAADLLRTAYVEPERERFLNAQIYDPDLDVDTYESILTDLYSVQPPVRDQYAPRQRSLTRWIASFSLNFERSKPPG